MIVRSGTFIHKCITGVESPENIDSYATMWISDGMTCDLWYYLGFIHPYHFSMFTDDKKFIYRYLNILSKIENMQDIDRIEYIHRLVEEMSIVSTVIKMDDECVENSSIFGQYMVQDDEIEIEFEQEENEDD